MPVLAYARMGCATLVRTEKFKFTKIHNKNVKFAIASDYAEDFCKKLDQLPTDEISGVHKYLVRKLVNVSEYLDVINLKYEETEEGHSYEFTKE